MFCRKIEDLRHHFENKKKQKQAGPLKGPSRQASDDPISGTETRVVVPAPSKCFCKSVSLQKYRFGLAFHFGFLSTYKKNPHSAPQTRHFLAVGVSSPNHNISSLPTISTTASLTYPNDIPSLFANFAPRASKTRTPSFFVRVCREKKARLAVFGKRFVHDPVRDFEDEHHYPESFDEVQDGG